MQCHTRQKEKNNLRKPPFWIFHLKFVFLKNKNIKKSTFSFLFPKIEHRAGKKEFFEKSKHFFPISSIQNLFIFCKKTYQNRFCFNFSKKQFNDIQFFWRMWKLFFSIFWREQTFFCNFFNSKFLFLVRQTKKNPLFL